MEWNVITGVIPPLNEADWQSEFDKYKQSPEYQKINFDMPLEEFKFIYHMEFWHRFLGRIAGLSRISRCFTSCGEESFRAQACPYTLA